MSSSTKNGQPRRKRKGRPRPLPPDVTARNLAIEKQRREALNENFIELASLLPSLASTQRLTKVLIVNKSIEHVRQQRHLCIVASRDIQALLAENHRLVSEVNALRAQTAGPALPLVKAMPMTEAMAQLAEVEQQPLGTFPAGFGDKVAKNSHQDQAPPRVRDDLPGVPRPTDDTLLVPFDHVAINLPPDDRPIDRNEDPSILCSDIGDGQPLLPYLDMFTSTNPGPSSQVLPAMPEPFNGMSTAYQEHVGLSGAPSLLLQQGNWNRYSDIHVN